jgi:hypothetical protein
MDGDRAGVLCPAMQRKTISLADPTSPPAVEAPETYGLQTCRQPRTYGDQLRHVAEHAGTVPGQRDAFGRCVVCVRLGWWRADT